MILRTERVNKNKLRKPAAATSTRMKKTEKMSPFGFLTLRWRRRQRPRRRRRRFKRKIERIKTSKAKIFQLSPQSEYASKNIWPYLLDFHLECDGFLLWCGQFFVTIAVCMFCDCTLFSANRSSNSGNHNNQINTNIHSWLQENQRKIWMWLYSVRPCHSVCLHTHIGQLLHLCG